MKKKILFLPDAGPTNPFQSQLITFLQQHGFKVAKDRARRFLTTYQAFKQFKPDIIYYDWIQSFILSKTLLVTLLKCVSFWLELLYVTRFRRIPILHTLHNMRNHAGHWRKIEYYVYRYFLQRCTRIRVYSETTRIKAARYFKLDKKKIFVVQDVPFHHYYPNASGRAESRHILNLDEYTFVYLFLGMIKPYKGLEDLIAAFQQMDLSSTCLLIAGAGDNAAYENSIREKIKTHPNILFHNRFIAVDAVQHYMNAADVVVLPFRHIEHSGSVDLALSFKKPVITRKTSFLQQLLTHQQQLLFDQNSQSLYNTLQTAQKMNLNAIGQQNFIIAEQSNYGDLLLFFSFNQIR